MSKFHDARRFALTAIASWAIVAAGCAGAVEPPPTHAPASTPPSVASIASATQTLVTATPLPSPTQTVAPSAEPSATAVSTFVEPPDLSPAFNGGEKIVFFRTDAERSANTPFVINVDGSAETQLGADLPTGIWSPDHTRLAFSQRVPDQSPLPGAETAWIRPATVNADGSAFKVLDAYPGRKMHLSPQGWSADASRIYVFSGGEDVDPADQGFYTLRSIDGGDLTRVHMAAPGPGHDQSVSVSPDGSALLVADVVPGTEGPHPRTLSLAGTDGALRQLTPSDLKVIDLEFFGGVSWAWSPAPRTPAQLAFCAFVGDDGSSALYTVDLDGSHLKQLVSPDVGAISAQWSPDGKQIAFTSERGRDNEVWVVNANGRGARQLTTNAEGWTSVVPIWSPDGSKLLFQRKRGDEVTLWTIGSDGSDLTQLSPTPVAADWVGPYAWWAAP